MLYNNSQPEREEIARALRYLDWYFREHDTVETPFGPQYTINGYQLKEIRIMPGFIKLSIYMLDRSVQQKDDVNGGDEVSFTYYRKRQEILLDND